jgi:hypothetical protein
VLRRAPLAASSTATEIVVRQHELRPRRRIPRKLLDDLADAARDQLSALRRGLVQHGRALAQWGHHVQHREGRLLAPHRMHSSAPDEKPLSQLSILRLRRHAERWLMIPAPMPVAASAGVN